ncbi:amidophosphoribosyltransferase [Nanoarchaeota archaeon]
MCGICMVTGFENSASICVAVLQRLQHRGHQGAKLVADHKDEMVEIGGLGRIDQVFGDVDFSKIHGNWAVGHTRYTTSGKTNLINSQPFEGDTCQGHMVFAHNGQFGTPHDIEQRKKEVKKQGYTLKHSSDSELFLASFCLADGDVEDKLIAAFKANKGSGSIVGIVGDVSFAGRKFGNRPLFKGRINGGYVFASEDFMLRNLDVKDVEEVKPGTLYVVQEGKLKEYKIWDETFDRHFDIFELFYFSHPLTTYHKVHISQLRKGFGAKLQKEHPVKVDVVAAVPDSGNHAALGYAHAAKVPFDLSIIRNHYTGRTFIGEKGERHTKADMKYDVDPSSVAGKKVAIVDDSLVRSTTARVLVQKLRNAGAKEIYFLLASPPIKFPNYYGIDMRSPDELIASKLSIPEIKKEIGVDYLGYLTLDGAYEVIRNLTGDKIKPGDFCDACFTGNYWDITITDPKVKEMMSNG